MARTRNIKPTFWTDEELGQVSRDARLLYIALWNHSDDRGVFEWSIGKIKIQVFPYDIDIDKLDIEHWLGELAGMRFIIQFEENGKSYGYIPTLLKHQEIKKPSKWHFTETVPNSTPLVENQYPTSPLKDEGRRMKVEGRRENNEEGTGKSSDSFPDKNVFELYDENIGKLTPLIRDHLLDAINEIGEEKLKEAIKIAATGPSKTWNYIEGIIRKWHTETKQKDNSFLPANSVTYDQALLVMLGKRDCNKPLKTVIEKEFSRRGVTDFHAEAARLGWNLEAGP